MLSKSPPCLIFGTMTDREGEQHLVNAVEVHHGDGAEYDWRIVIIIAQVEAGHSYIAVRMLRV